MIDKKIYAILAVALFCMSSSCRKEPPPVTPPPTDPVDSCAYTEYIITPITQVYITGWLSRFSFNPLDANQLSFTYQQPDGDAGLAVYDFTSSTVIWTTESAYDYADWGRNGKILFWKNVGGQIGVINGDGTGEVIIETQGFAFNPKWSYSGNRMIYTKKIGPQSQNYQIIADASGTPLDTLQLHSSNYSLAANDNLLIYNSYVGANVGFRTLNLQNGIQDSLPVDDPIIAGLAEDLTWDADGVRFYWRCNGVIYQGNMATKTYGAISQTGCAGFNVTSLAKHPGQEKFIVQKTYRKNQGPDTLYLSIMEYFFDPTTQKFNRVQIPLAQ